MEKVICEVCKKKFLKKTSQIERSKKNFCSSFCSVIGRRSGKYMKCKKCGKNTYKQRMQILKSKDLFCSKKCSVLWKNRSTYGKKHPNWKGGEYSYQNIIKRNGNKKLCSLCMLDNQDVLIVHHIDRNRRNNSVDNLVWLCRNCHFLVHNYEEESKKLSKIIKNG